MSRAVPGARRAARIRDANERTSDRGAVPRFAGRLCFAFDSSAEPVMRDGQSQASTHPGKDEEELVLTQEEDREPAGHGPLWSMVTVQLH